MADREITDVIDQIKVQVPPEKTVFLERLDWVYQDAIYRAPEDHKICWEYLQQYILRHIGLYPKEEWHFQVLSVFSAVSVADLKEDVAKLTSVKD